MQKAQIYGLTDLLEQTRKKRSVSKKNLVKGIMSVKTYERLLKKDVHVDKIVMDTLLARLGINTLVYECYITQKEYDYYETCMRIRQECNQILRMLYERRYGNPLSSLINKVNGEGTLHIRKCPFDVLENLL